MVWVEWGAPGGVIVALRSWPFLERSHLHPSAPEWVAQWELSVGWALLELCTHVWEGVGVHARI